MSSPAERHVSPPCYVTSSRLSRTISRRCSRGLGATLAVSAIRCLRDTRQPVALIGIGLPGVGKTEPLSFLTPYGEDDELAEHFYRSDGFTPAAFVSHLASKSTAALDEIDLLPRIRDRTLLTPALAPLFRSRGSGLQQRTSVLASVLDGHGHVSDSGAHGRRGHQVGRYSVDRVVLPMVSES
jgi:hypothetical protein